jgi:polysaccharide biosynthesis/export protein
MPKALRMTLTMNLILNMNMKMIRRRQTVAAIVLVAGRLLAQSENATPPPAAPAEKNANDTRPNQTPEKGHSDDSYVIGPNDVLSINVWKEPDITRSIPVRSDGKISLPLAGELQAGGQTPRQLEQEITKRLQSYISDPEVTVIVSESRSQKINILGMVSRPGTYLLSGATTVLDAIAMTGGFKDFAKQKSIYILRPSPDGTQKRFAFNYKDVIKGKNLEQNIRLQAGDTIVVP